MNKETFYSEMARTSTALRDEIDDATLLVYWDEFRNWSDSDFCAAMDSCRHELDRFPTVKHIIERGSLNPSRRAAAAWLVVSQVTFGAKLIQFEDPLINATIRMTGGLEYYGSQSDHAFETWLKPKFLEQYKAFIQVPPRGDIVGRLGSVDAANEAMLAKLGIQTRTVFIKCDYMDSTPRIEYEREHLPVVVDLAKQLSVERQP